MGMAKRIELEMRGRAANVIKDLNLDNCRSQDIEGLTSDFSALECLSMINVGLQSLANFPKLGNLKRLDLSDNRITSSLQGLTGCPKLANLSLSGNKIKDFDALKPLKDLPSLKSVDLFNCEVTSDENYRDKVFAMLPQIVYLDGFDTDDHECEDDDEDGDLDGDDDEDDDEENEDEDDDEEGDDDEDDEEEEDFDPEADDDDDELGGEEEEDGEEGEEDENEEEDDDDEDEGAAARGTKRKHEEEEEEEEDDA